MKENQKLGAMVNQQKLLIDATSRQAAIFKGTLERAKIEVSRIPQYERDVNRINELLLKEKAALQALIDNGPKLGPPTWATEKELKGWTRYYIPKEGWSKFFIITFIQSKDGIAIYKSNCDNNSKYIFHNVVCSTDTRKSVFKDYLKSIISIRTVSELDFEHTCEQVSKAKFHKALFISVSKFFKDCLKDPFDRIE